MHQGRPSQKRDRHAAECVTLRLDSLTYGGDAIGRLEGKAFFVRGGIPGERVRAEILADHGRFAQARVIEVIEPAPERVTPRCPHFGAKPGSCGGCAWQHIDYAAQVRWKTEVVREQLRRIGHLDSAPVRDTIPSPAIWAYRNHATWSVAPNGRLGFQAELLEGEHGGQILELWPALGVFRVQVVDCFDFEQPIVFLGLFWRADLADHEVAGAQPKTTDLALRNVDVVGAGHHVLVGA